MRVRVPAKTLNYAIRSKETEMKWITFKLFLQFKSKITALFAFIRTLSSYCHATWQFGPNSIGTSWQPWSWLISMILSSSAMHIDLMSESSPWVSLLNYGDLCKSLLNSFLSQLLFKKRSSLTTPRYLNGSTIKFAMREIIFWMELT